MEISLIIKYYVLRVRAIHLCVHVHMLCVYALYMHFAYLYVGVVYMPECMRICVCEGQRPALDIFFSCSLPW